jgi:hypothetical protein
MTDSQLDHSLTSMDWLYRIGSLNKQLLDAASNKNLDTPSSTSAISSSIGSNTSSNSSDSLLLSPFLNASKNYSSITEQTPCAILNSVNDNNSKNIHQMNKIVSTSKVNHSAAQRAEPHRPIDLNAEYKGGDHNRREGKPPYSYVNLITFAINSTPKKRMTLNEIYQWISENFNFYKYAGNGWKVYNILKMF